jgi:hypothetical protein
MLHMKVRLMTSTPYSAGDFAAGMQSAAATSPVWFCRYGRPALIQYV